MARILFPYVGDTVGGSHISSLKLASSLPKGLEPVIATHELGLLNEYLEAVGLSAIKAPNITAPRLRPRWRQLGRLRACRTTLVPFLRQNKIDLVHTHDLRMHLAWGQAAEASGVPHIWHQRTPLDDPRCVDFSRHTARFITVSDFVRSSLPPRVKARADVLFNPFDQPQIPKGDQTRLKLLNDMGTNQADAIVGFVSNFSERKRPEFFVDIARRIKEAMPGRRILFPMFGEARAPHVHKVRQRIRDIAMEPEIQILGTRFPFDPWLASFDILIAPARNEALGRTLIEATMLKVPLIATREGGNVEIIRHNQSGYLATPEDAQDYADGALRFLTDVTWSRQMTETAYRDSQRKFSLQKHLTGMQTIYDSVLSSAKSA